MNMNRSNFWMLVEKFVCPGCNRASSQSPGGNGFDYLPETDGFDYLSETESLQCQRCKLIILRKHAASGVPLWITEDRRCLRIDQMETSHLQRCIAMIFHKNNAWRGRFMEPLIRELKKRTEAEKSLDFVTQKHTTNDNTRSHC